MIPVNEPLLDGNEKRYLAECIDSGWISSEGPFVARFEQAFANYNGVAHGVAVCNGTAALEAALHGLGVGPGDEVIMPAFTIISCALACLRLGAKPVLCDIDPLTWTMDPSLIEDRITPATKAIMAVHMYGHPVEMDPVMEIATRHNLKVLEDAAEVHGAEYFSKRAGCWQSCGSIGHAAATSFYANKIITTGEGGMVLTSDPKVAERAAAYRNLCFGKTERFNHESLGYNFRMTNLQAAVGLAQVEQIERFVAIKRECGGYYREQFSKVLGMRFMPQMEWARSVYWMYCIELDAAAALDANAMRAALHKRGIATRPFFKGLHEQPALCDLGLFGSESYPCTEKAYRQGLYLPSGMTLTHAQMDEVVRSVKEVLDGGV